MRVFVLLNFPTYLIIFSSNFLNGTLSNIARYIDEMEENPFFPFPPPQHACPNAE